jgi:hypothetical protein
MLSVAANGSTLTQNTHQASLRRYPDGNVMQLARLLCLSVTRCTNAHACDAKLHVKPLLEHAMPSRSTDNAIAFGRASAHTPATAMLAWHQLQIYYRYAWGRLAGIYIH